MPRQARLDIPSTLVHIMVREISSEPYACLIATKRRKEVGLSAAEIARHLEGGHL